MCVSDRVPVHTRNVTSGTIFDPELDYFSPIVKDVIPAIQRSSCSCLHCTGSVSAVLRFIISYSVNVPFLCGFRSMSIKTVA